MITQEEYKLLKEYREQSYKWIARDANDRLYVYRDTPAKSNAIWNGTMNIQEKHFTCVTWEDEEPTKIDDLIKDYEAHKIVVDETDKVTIPQFVAEWIEHVKDMERPVKLELLFGTLSMPIEVREWLIKDDRRTDILARAWLDGYTITSKRYEIPLPRLETALGGQQYLTYDDIYFAYFKCDYYKQVWSEDELKNIPNEYLKYKVEVE